MWLLQLLTTLAAVNLVSGQNQTVVTWFSTSFISEEYLMTRTVQYGDTAVTPVPTSTAQIVISTSILSEPTVSRNINHTSWYIAQVTIPVTTRLATVWMTPISPPTTTLNGTATETVWTTPYIAIVAFSPTVCANNGTGPKTTVTEYTGTYTPFPGQSTALPTTFPTAVTSYFRLTASYRLYAYTGITTTYTSTVTGTNYLSTTIIGTTTLDPNAGARGYTRTRYATTVTTTASDYHLAYTTRPVTNTACGAAEITPTVTYAARCAPTNLIAERDGRGVSIRLLPRDWSFPLGFPQTLIGIPGGDASACCQLCVDNKGCAVSKWSTGWDGGCALYYWNHGEGKENGTCGAGNALEYFGDSYALPRQGSFIQTGCGELKYLGGKNPFCPDCEVD